MTPDDAVAAVFEALAGAGIPYMLVGSLASNFHGIPRSTRDADFVVELAAGRLARLASLLPPGLRLEPQPAFESVTGTTRFLITLTGSSFVCELFVLSDDDHDQARFRRRQIVQVLDQQAQVASVEDMIVTKLRWAIAGGRGKDSDDVRNMIAVQDTALDWAYIHHWVERHGTAALLADIRASLTSHPNRRGDVAT